MLGRAAAAINIFLPTPSARRATARWLWAGHELNQISTHALREEGDQGKATGGNRNHNFYPRPPRGGRPEWWKPCC